MNLRSGTRKHVLQMPWGEGGGTDGGAGSMGSSRGTGDGGNGGSTSSGGGGGWSRTWSDSTGSVTTTSDGGISWSGKSGSGAFDSAAADKAVADRLAAEQAAAAQEAARVEAARVAAEQAAAEQAAAEQAAADRASQENLARVSDIAGWSVKPGTPIAQTAEAASNKVAAEATPTATENKVDTGDVKQESLTARVFNLAGLGKPGEDGMAQAGATIGSNYANTVQESIDKGVPTSSLMGEPTRVQLQAMDNMGYGKLEGVNPNNLTGQNVEGMLASANTAEAMGRLGQFATNMAINSIPGAPYIKAGLAAYNAVDNGMSVADAAKAVGSDLVAGWAAGKINMEVGKAIGADGREALSLYNNGAALANLAGYNVPGLNAGSFITGKVRDAIGAPTLSGQPTGLTATDGSAITSPGWSTGSRPSGGGGGGNQVPDAPTQGAPTAPAPNVVSYLTDMRANYDGAGFGRAVRGGVKARQANAQRRY